MTTVRSVLFDMDGVFFDYDFAARFAALGISTGVAAAEIEARIFKSGYEDDADWGRIDADAYLTGIAERLDAEVDAETWLAARAGAMTPYPEMFALARRLKAQLPVALLSNNGWLLRANIARLHPDLDALFAPHLYFSAELGGGKEDPATFGPLLDRLGWTPGTTLFVDDSPEYIAAAGAAGLRTHLFAGVDGFRAALADLGLLD
ncbi:MAG: HAD family phosphatase [Rhodospirillaceae bacterium]